MAYRLIITLLASALAPLPAAAQEAQPFRAPACASGQGATTDPTNEDMTQPSEAAPHGTFVTSTGKEFSWARHPRVWRGNEPQPGWTHVTSTAMIYARRDQPVSSGVRVQVRDIQLFVKPRSLGAWCLLDSRAAPGGGLYVENFDGDAHLHEALRPEESGGVSIRLLPGYLFHFWGNRVAFPEGGLDGVFVQYEARIIPEDGADDEAVARAAYVGAASADYWRGGAGSFTAVGVSNEDVGIARFKRLSGAWRVFTMSSNGGPAMAPPPR